MNILHEWSWFVQAAGLGHMEVARAIIDRAPEAVNAKDHMDRTPLHYAAALKDQNQMYQLLVDADATDHLEDKVRTYYYQTRTKIEWAPIIVIFLQSTRNF